MLDLNDYFLAAVDEVVEEYQWDEKLESATKIVLRGKEIATMAHNAEGDPSILCLCIIKSSLQEGQNGLMLNLEWIDHAKVSGYPTVNFFDLSRNLASEVKKIIEN